MTAPVRPGTPRPRFGAAVAWSYAMDGGREVISVLVTLLLAGILGPEAFGTVAMAAIYVAFIDMLQRQGLLAALIQRQDLEDDHADTAFWLVLAASVVLTVASVGLSGWWADVNDLPELRPVVVALSGLLPLNALVLVQEALLRRALRFKELALRTNTATLVGGLAGVALALAGAGVWALVAQQLVTAALSLLIIWRISAWRPRLRFSSAAARHLGRFSSGSMLSGIGVFVNNRSDALLVGVLFGPAAVGLYRFAGRLVEMLVGVSGRALASVSLPELARLQDRRPELGRRLQDVHRLSGLATIPLLGLAAACADPLMELMGSEWREAAGPLRLLCVVGAVRALQVTDGPLLQAIGRPHLQAGLTWGVGAMSAGSFMAAGVVLADAAEATQVVGIALARAALYLAVLLPMSLVIARTFAGVPVRHTLRTVAAPATAALVGVGVVTVVRLATGADRLHPVADLGVSGAAAAVTTALALLALAPDVGRVLRRAWRRLRGRTAAVVG